MKSVLTPLAACAAVLSFQTISAQEAVCHRCEEVREYNAEHHKNFEYFEDYVKSDDFDKDDGNPFIKRDQPTATAGVKTP